MRMSAAGMVLLKRCEGFKGQVYRDAAGWPTIGYGHRLVGGETFAGGVDEAQASALLAADLEAAERAVERLAKRPLAQGQFDALVDFCFNMGEGRLAGSTLLKELNAGSYAAAGEQLLRWDHAGGHENAGLKARRAAEFALWSGAGAEAGSPPL